eukprot:scaffold120260_cov15-Tisochrysis_lutea.AAC.1
MQQPIPSSTSTHLPHLWHPPAPSSSLPPPVVYHRVQVQAAPFSPARHPRSWPTVRMRAQPAAAAHVQGAHWPGARRRRTAGVGHHRLAELRGCA